MEDESVLDRAAPGPELTVRYGPAPEHVIDVWSGTGPPDRPLVVFLHGGFWRPAYDRVHTYPLANAVRDAGWPIATVEYRRTPGRPGHSTDDVAAALGTPIPVPHKGIVLAGHSAGGHLALWVAASTAPAGLLRVVALAPVADLVLADELRLGGGAVRAFLGADPGAFAELDPVRLPAPGVPTVLIQGERDDTVPPAVAESYRAAHPATELITLPGAGHYGLIDPLAAAWPTVLAALTR